MTEEETNETTEEAPAADAPGEDAAGASAGGAEPEPALPPKERRRRARSTHSGDANAPKTLDDRLAERAAKRRANAAERRRWRTKTREKRRAEGPREGTPPAERRGTGSPRVRQGIVVSDKADKTITVRVDEARRHRRYRKIMRTSVTFHAHDEANDAHVGDTVRIVEARPLSRLKRWRLVDVLERAR